MTDEPPPNPADWLGNDLGTLRKSESRDTRQTTPQRGEEPPLTWEELISYRDAYRGRHSGAASRF